MRGKDTGRVRVRLQRQIKDEQGCEQTGRPLSFTTSVTGLLYTSATQDGSILLQQETKTELNHFPLAVRNNVTVNGSFTALIHQHTLLSHIHTISPTKDPHLSEPRML